MRLACVVAGGVAILGVTVFGLAVFGQASRVPSVTKAPGETVTLEVSADSQRATGPAAFKWEVLFPAQLMEMEGGAPVISSVAKDAGKSLQCAARSPYSSVCVLSGGKKPIPNGTLAIYHFKIRTDAPPGTTTLRINKTEATTVDARAWTLNSTEATVIIK